MDSISTNCSAARNPEPPHRRGVRRGALGVLASLLVVLAAAAFGQRPAEASEFYSNPTLSVLNSCENGEYHYEIGLYNLQANDSTRFTVSVTIGSGDAATSVHDIAGGGLEWLDFVVPEAETGSFHVTNDDDPSIDWLAEPKADCVADTETYLHLVCAEDTGSASVLYKWVNTSYTSADFTLHLPDGTTQLDSLVWADGQRSLDVPVTEGSHVNASIDVDGLETSSIDQTVDCVDDPTTTSTTVPSTTVPSTTVPTPATMPSTTTTMPATVLNGGDEFRGVPLAGFVSPPAAAVEPVRTDAVAALASTGRGSGALALLGIGLVAAGIVCWLYTRMFRTESGSTS